MCKCKIAPHTGTSEVSSIRKTKIDYSCTTLYKWLCICYFKLPKYLVHILNHIFWWMEPLRLHIWGEGGENNRYSPSLPEKTVCDPVSQALLCTSNYLKRVQVATLCWQSHVLQLLTLLGGKGGGRDLGNTHQCPIIGKSACNLFT